MSDNRSYSEVVRGVQYRYGQRSQGEAVESDEETITTDNKSWKSQSSLESISQGSMQTKIIIEMKEELKQMREEQQFLRNHIMDLESTVITLAEDETDTESYASAKSKAKKLKRKRDKYNSKMKDQKQDKIQKSTLRQTKKMEKETSNSSE